MYENEVEIQSSISVRFTATYNRIPKSNCAISSAILIVLPPLFSYDHRKIRLRSRVKLSSLSLSLELNKNRTTIILSIRLKNRSIAGFGLAKSRCRFGVEGARTLRAFVEAFSPRT